MEYIKHFVEFAAPPSCRSSMLVEPEAGPMDFVQTPVLKQSQDFEDI